MADSYTHLTDSELAGVEAHVARLSADGIPHWDEQLVELRRELDRRGVRAGSAAGDTSESAS